MADEDNSWVSELSSKLSKIEEQRTALIKQIQEYKKTIEDKNLYISKLKTEIKLEKLKSTIIAKLCNIDMDTLFVEKEDGIHIHNFEGGNIPIIVHEYIDGKEGKENKHVIKLKKQNLQTGNKYRTVKNKVELKEEKPEEEEEKIKKIEEVREELIKNNGLDISVSDTTTLIENAFDVIAKSRVFKKDLAIIRDNRSKLLSNMSLDSYTKLISTHITRLKGILATKKYDVKKINETVEKSLSPLDMRLIAFGKYYDTQIDNDDLSRLKISLKINTDYPKRYIPLAYDEMYKKFDNYSIALFTIKENLKRVLVNPFGFSNVCYLDLETSLKEDPYSFYILEKISDDGTRCWKMECRLMEFSRLIAFHIRGFCVKLFRRIYVDCFSDNVYRNDYFNKVTIGQYDLEQLLLNAVELSKPYSFCNIVRNLIKKHCVIKPSKIDKFNLTGDDKIAKRNFNQEQDSYENIVSLVRALFDNISDTDLTEFLENKLGLISFSSAKDPLCGKKGPN